MHHVCIAFLFQSGFVVSVVFLFAFVFATMGKKAGQISDDGAYCGSLECLPGGVLPCMPSMLGGLRSSYLYYKEPSNFQKMQKLMPMLVFDSCNGNITCSSCKSAAEHGVIQKSPWTKGIFLPRKRWQDVGSKLIVQTSTCMILLR